MQIFDPWLAQSYNVAGRIWLAGRIVDTAAVYIAAIVITL